jgi:hypothetical protein
MTLELSHPSTQQSSHFRCYSEEHVFTDSALLDMMIDSAMDDDCATDDEQVEAAREHLGMRLMRAINSYKQ